MQPMKTVHVQVVCRRCATPYRTQVRGGNTRCPQCRTSRYVRRDQEWEGPVPAALEGAASRAERAAARPPVWCTCGCGHVWRSRAKDHQRIRCPACGTGVRVPLRTYDNTDDPRPRPRSTVPPSRHRSPTTPNPARPPPADLDPTAPAAAPGPRPGRRADSRQPPGGPAPAADSRPGPAGTPHPSPGDDDQEQEHDQEHGQDPTPSMTPAAAPTPERDRKRRDSVAQLVRSLSGSLLIWYDTPAGWCEVLDATQPKDRQRCRGMASRAVVFAGPFVGELTAYACPTHAEPLATLANSTPGNSARILSINV